MGKWFWENWVEKSLRTLSSIPVVIAVHTLSEKFLCVVNTEPAVIAENKHLLGVQPHMEYLYHPSQRSNTEGEEEGLEESKD